MLLWAIFTGIVFVAWAFGSYWTWPDESRKGYLGPHVLAVLLIGSLLWLVIWQHLQG